VEENIEVLAASNQETQSNACAIHGWQVWSASAVGLSVLLCGWILNIAAFRVVLLGYPAMVPNTALGLTLYGIAL